MMNMSSVLHDPQVFENPHEFNPDRYLTGDVELKKKRTIPFSLGIKIFCFRDSFIPCSLFSTRF